MAGWSPMIMVTHRTGYAELSDRWVLSIGMSKVNLGKRKSVLLILGVIPKSETIEHGHTSLLHIFECVL